MKEPDLKSIDITEWEQLPLLLSIREVSNILRISISTAYSLMEEQGFPKKRIGKTYKVSRDELKRWLNE